MTIAPARILTISTEYVRTPILATESGARVDPTADIVQFSFPPEDGQPTNWVNGSWETSGTLHYARCLIGPDGGTIELDVGRWDVYVRIVDSPETPVLKSGVLEVY